MDEIFKQLAHVELSYPFGDAVHVYKLGGKMFALTDEFGSYISLKNDPIKNDFLKATFVEIKAGYHLNKRHWITIENLEQLPNGLLEELIIDSYEIVKSKLSKKGLSELEKPHN